MKVSQLKILIPLLGIGHGLNDLIAGYFLGSLLHLGLDAIQISMGLFIYNLLAFGGQYPVALLLEKIKNPKKFLLIAYGLNTVAVGLFTELPQLAIVIAGIASAFYHVAGGTVCAGNNKAANIGIFGAPGVAGLIAGGFLAYHHLDIIIWLLIAAVIFFMYLLTFPEKKRVSEIGTEKEIIKKIVFDRHDLIMILLLTIISFRSVIWNVFQLIHTNNYEWLIAIAIAAFAGKLAGGWLADKIGWRLYTYISLLLATPLITFFKNELVFFCLGIGLLQSSVPATTSMLIHSLKGKTERAIGLSFGAAIIGGAIIFYTPARSFLLSNQFFLLITFLMLLLLFLSKRVKGRLKI